MNLKIKFIPFANATWEERIPKEILNYCVSCDLNLAVIR